MIEKQYYRAKNFFYMEFCSRHCMNQTLYAVMIGISPIVICLLLIAIARLILHCLELSYNRRQKITDRRRSSSIFRHPGRPTLSYTPVSLTELQRIIQGDYHSQQQSESSSSFVNNDRNSPKPSHLMKSILAGGEPSPSSSSNTLANLVIRRNAINSTPFTALLAPISSSTSPTTIDVINEQSTRRPSVMTIKHETIETTTSATINNNNHNHTSYNNTNDSLEPESTDFDSFVPLPKTMTTTTTTTTVVLEEFLDFHSVHSIPYSLNLVNSLMENDF